MELNDNLAPPWAMAFGNSNNHTEMLQLMGANAAIGNATEQPKEITDDIVALFPKTESTFTASNEGVLISEKRNFITELCIHTRYNLIKH